MDEVARLQAAIGVAGFLTQFAFAVVLAVLLRRFERRLGRGYLREWALAWTAVAAAYLAGAWGLATRDQLPASDWSRIAASVVYAVGGYWHAAWILFGTAAIATGRVVSRRGGRAILGALAALGVLTTLVWAFDPDAWMERWVTRVGLRALIVGLVLVAAGVVLWRVARRTPGGIGPGFVSLAFLAYGIHDLGQFAGIVALVPRLPGYLDAPLEVLLTGLLGLATVIWLFEEEQHRLREASRQIERLSYYDVTTGLPNRKLFVDRLRGWLDRAERLGERGALLFLDLDHFKRVNDSYGHDTGDLLLAAVGDRLLHSVREGDTVARIGGDEFSVLLPGVTGAAEAAGRADELLSRLRQPLRVGDRNLAVDGSVGISLCPTDGNEAAVLLRKADSAMSRAKELGRGRYVQYDEAMIGSARDRFRLETEMREGRLEQGLELFYQPIVRTGSGEIVGAEALLRWHHPERGLLLPGEFLFAVESTALARAISRWVLRTATSQIASWRERFEPELRVAVNLTARAFEDPQLTGLVSEILDEARLPAEALELEITETMALLRGEDPASILADLRRRGVRLAVDDFGTGYSSLSYLRELPIEIVKLDASFIHDLGRKPQDSRIVGAVIQLAHGLGMQVVAEGVEEEEQMAVLEMLHCDRMQGFLFSRPLPAAEFESLLESARPFRVGEAAITGLLAQ
ncbi:MAG TPA: EAL domain-containing protein [Thermoanaerobaculia bacterium]|nr:EAL domain-containing protein [Thermoanaerobaculia bacterium]